MIIFQKGSIFSANTEVIAHQVNCMGVMGGGVAKQIKDNYPEVFLKYYEYCNKPDLLYNRNMLALYRHKNILGTCLLVKTSDDMYIANCFGQYSYGRNHVYTENRAFKSSIESMINQMKKLDLSSVAIPHNMGAGLAGGNWFTNYSVIKELFESMYPNAIVKICKL